MEEDKLIDPRWKDLYKTQKSIAWTQLHEHFLHKMNEILIENDKLDHDQEEEHYIADRLLCELLTILGFEDLVKIYDEIGKWYA